MYVAIGKACLARLHISRCLNVHSDFLSDFSEGVQDFRIIAFGVEIKIHQFVLFNYFMQYSM